MNSSPGRFSQTDGRDGNLTANGIDVTWQNEMDLFYRP